LVRLHGHDQQQERESFFSLSLSLNFLAVKLQEAALMFRETPCVGDWEGREELPGRDGVFKSAGDGLRASNGAFFSAADFKEENSTNDSD